MKRIIKICVGAAICALTYSGAHAEKLVLLHTNDTHSQIDPTEQDLGGIARRKVVIDSVKSVNPNTLLIDAGDIVQGTLFFNIYKGEVEEKLMNALGYDLRILGNHEFDNGIDDLAKNISTSTAELLASNYQMRGTPLEGLFKPYTIKEYDGKKIAFLPLNLRPEGMISTPNYTGMGYVDAMEAANNLAWMLKNIMQVDYVVALSHLGYDSNMPPNDKQIAAMSKDIDVIIGGHSHTLINPDDPTSKPHTVKNADGKDVLVAQTGRKGTYIGEITIDLDHLDTLPDYKVIKIDSRLDDKVSPEIEQIIAPYRAEVDRLNSNVVTKTARELDRDSNGLLNYMSDFTAERGRQLADNVDFAIINRGGLRNTLPKGNITEGQLITLLPFFNRVEVIDIKGSDLAAAFDQMASIGGNGVSKEVVAEFDPDTRKCTSILINGKPLDPNATYRIATNDYLAQGGDYMTTLKNHKKVAESPNYYFDDIIYYFTKGAGKGKTINPKDNARMYPKKK